MVRGCVLLKEISMGTILTKTKGFTPVIDVLAEELGLMTAVVYGIVWRYCQMEKKICSASRETIAKHASISVKTVDRHLDKLCRAGYLKDLHPDWKHRPHIYVDTGKLKIEALVRVRTGKTESPTSEEGETESPTGETESPTRLDRESYQGETESPTKILFYDSKHESKEGEKEGDFPEKSKPADPLMQDLERRTAGGDYADPAEVGGADNLAAFGLFCLYDKRGKAPPRQGTKEHTQQRDRVRGALRAYGYQQAPSDLIEKAAEIHCERKGDWTNVYYSSFAADFGEALQDAEYFLKHGYLPSDGQKVPRDDPGKFDRARAMTLERLEHGNQ